MNFHHIALALLLSIAPALYAEDDHEPPNELSYQAMVDSQSRFKCLYGYAASKTGDHAAAVAIFEDCIARWDDVYSMIWLAHLYEDGAGVEQSMEKAFALLARGAALHDEAGYSSLARYHYGRALYRGEGTQADPDKAVLALRAAAAEGIDAACAFLRDAGRDCH